MQNEKNIIFPSETKELISKTLKEFDIEENDAEMYQKIVSGQKSINATIAYLVKKIAIGSINFNEMVKIMEQELKFPTEKAEQIAKELNEKIIPLGKEEISLEKSSENKEKTPSSNSKIANDAYKEPLD